jgi:hypothetical protein
MKTVLCALAAIVVLLAAITAADAKRHHVVIHKRAPSQQPANVTIAAIPVVGMFYDLARRTDCRGDVLGAGGPGFDSPITPATGNVMIPATQRSKCMPQPKEH